MDKILKTWQNGWKVMAKIWGFLFVLTLLCFPLLLIIKLIEILSMEFKNNALIIIPGVIVILLIFPFPCYFANKITKTIELDENNK